MEIAKTPHGKLDAAAHSRWAVELADQYWFNFLPAVSSRGGAPELLLSFVIAYSPDAVHN